jgi:hypothetical protein
MMRSMRAVIATLGLLAGCDQVLGLDTRDAGDVDGVARCFGRAGAGGMGLIDVCIDPADAPATLPVRASLSTGDAGDAGNCDLVVEQTDAISTEACVVFAQTIAIANPLEVRGSRPLVLLALETLSVTAPIDLISRGMTLGPGAHHATCVPGSGTGSSLGSGAGAGGSFGGMGGNGGMGGSTTNPGGAAGASAPPISALAIVRGGCSGGSGGVGQAPGGSGGGAGGAIYLIAGTSMVIAGRINASGEGGGPGGGHGTGGAGGGGGGGSGGLIGFDAPQIEITSDAVLVANGGGGGGGGGNGGATGSPGADPNVATGSDPYGAIGGSGGTSGGGSGGMGERRGELAARGSNADLPRAGGGAGGGGAGLIVLFSTTAPTVGSPKITPPLR